MYNHSRNTLKLLMDIHESSQLFHFLTLLSEMSFLVYCFLFNGERGRSTIHIKVLVDEVTNIIISEQWCFPETIADCDSWLSISEDMNFHTVLYQGFLKVIVLKPEKSEIIAMLFMNPEIVEHLLNVPNDCYSIFTERQAKLLAMELTLPHFTT